MSSRLQNSNERLKTYQRYLKKEQIYCPPKRLESETEGQLWEAGNYVLGPALNAFVIWVLKEAERSGKKRLYFLARDGYFMYRAAQIYTEKFHLDVECRYVSCSRYSLRIPVFHLDEEEAMEYICRDSIGVNLNRMMNRAGLTREEKQEVLAEIDRIGQEHETIPYASLKKVKETLVASNTFMNYMRRHSRDAMPVLADYLKQEGFLDGTDDAVVDSGWVGSMQKTLNQVLAYMGRETKLEGYYWGLYELPPGVERALYHCYYFSPEGQLREKVYFNNNLFEAVFSAPHGMTLRYEKKKDKWEPVYSRISQERKTYMERLENILITYTKQAAEELFEKYGSVVGADCERERRAMKKVLKLFMGKPTKAEAEACGRLTFCDDVLEYENHQLAVKMDEKDLEDNHFLNKILVMLGVRRQQIKESAWYEGSAVRFSKRPGYHLIQYGMYKYLLYMRQMYMWRRRHVQEKEG